MGEETGTGFVHVVAADGVEEGAARGVAEGEFVDEIVAELEAGGEVVGRSRIESAVVRVRPRPNTLRRSRWLNWSPLTGSSRK